MLKTKEGGNMRLTTFDFISIITLSVLLGSLFSLLLYGEVKGLLIMYLILMLLATADLSTRKALLVFLAVPFISAPIASILNDFDVALALTATILLVGRCVHYAIRELHEPKKAD